MSTKLQAIKTNLKYGATLLLGIFVLAIGGGSLQPVQSSTSPTLIPPENLSSFSLGYNEIIADALWLRTIQDFDYCENKPIGVSDPNAFKCEKGWVYHMVNAVTELAPYFRPPYYTGALMLSIIVNDIEGSSLIFDKGVRAFPDDWRLLYTAAYQAMIEEHDNAKASMLLVRAGKHGAPAWVFALAAKLQQKSGQLEFAKSILAEAVELNPTGPGVERIQQRLDEVEKELAKQPKAP